MFQRHRNTSKYFLSDYVTTAVVILSLRESSPGISLILFDKKHYSIYNKVLDCDQFFSRLFAGSIFAKVTGTNPVEALIFQASSFQLVKLENLLQ